MVLAAQYGTGAIYRARFNNIAAKLVMLYNRADVDAMNRVRT